MTEAKITGTNMLGANKIGIMRIILGIALVCIVVIPLIPLVIYSFAKNWHFPDLLPKQINLQGWQYLLRGSKRILQAFWNSTVITSIALLVSFLLGFPAGRMLGLRKFRGKRVVQFLVYLPFLVPPLAVIVGLHVTFVRLTIADTFIGVVLAHLLVTLPYSIISMQAIFANYNIQYEEVARSLGCSSFCLFRRVIFPLVAPGIMCSAIFVILVSWNQYVISLIIGGGRVFTLPVLMLVFVGAGDFILAGVVSIIFLLPVFILFFFTSRILREHMGIIR